MPEASTGGTARIPLKGILIMLAAMIVLPYVDTSAKLLGDTIHVLQIAWGRYVCQTVVALPVALWLYGRRGLWPKRPGTQALRAFLLPASNITYFAALLFLPLADTLAIFFIFPFFVTAAAPFALGERIGIWRWSAVAVGFLGVLLIVRPGFGAISTGVFWAIGSAACFACYALATRRLAGSDPPILTQTITCILATIALSVAMPYVWVEPTFEDWLLFLALGASGGIGHLLVTMAYEHIDASVIAPLSYLEMVTTVTLGYLVFHELPVAATWMGIALICGSGIVIAWRETARSRPRRHPPPMLPGS
ncbi:MAG: DMT family transporter [Hyphomicrobiaceae bacterium]